MTHALSAEEHARIRTAIESVERETSADLALVVVRASDRYSMYPPLVAGFGALIITAILVIARPHTGGRAAILIELILLIALTVIFDWLPIRLALVPTRVRHAHARQLARREFMAHSRRGAERPKLILLFVSLGEHYVEIIADPQTHALAPGSTWERIVADFLTNVKAGRTADGVLAAIEGCGAILKTHHPIAD
jgi:putative membrane protein